MLQNPCKTLVFKENMVYKIPPGGAGGGGGVTYPASDLKPQISWLFELYKDRNDSSRLLLLFNRLNTDIALSGFH